MTKISYFGKQNSTPGPVVPLAMFLNENNKGGINDDDDGCMIMWMEAVILFRCVKLVIGHVRTATNSFQKMVQRLLQHIKQTLIFFKGKKVVQKKKKSLLSKMKKQVDISSSIIYSGEYCLC